MAGSVNMCPRPVTSQFPFISGYVFSTFERNSKEGLNLPDSRLLRLAEEVPVSFAIR